MNALSKRISYRQLVEWACYFKHKDGLREKLDHYMAQLTAWIACQATGKTQKPEDFYLRTGSQKGQDISAMPAENVEAFWCGILGINREAESNG